MDNDIIKAILDYVWIPILTAVGLLWGKFVGIDVRTRLLEQAAKYHGDQRLEDRKLRDEQRLEILKRIDSHHTTVMEKLERLETRVKNGH